MLLPTDYLAVKDYELNRLPLIVADARQHQMLADAGLIGRPWYSRLFCSLLARLGRALAAVGDRPARRHAPSALAPRY